MTVLSRFRRPEYTGENRCIPCTLANSAISLGLAAVVAALWARLVGPSWWAPALVVLAVSALAIWLRGYLVPGTPELTKRYLPEWVLAYFDKAPERPSTSGHDPDADAETLLVDGGVVEPCADVDDLCLRESFRTAWYERMRTVEDVDEQREAIATQLGVAPDRVEVERHDDGAVVAVLDGARAGQWESHAALVADLAAARELPDWLGDWDALSPRARSEVLGGLRVFVEACPDCGSPVALDQETRESCCRSYEVATASCTECGARLLEVPYEEGMAA